MTTHYPEATRIANEVMTTPGFLSLNSDLREAYQRMVLRGFDNNSIHACGRNITAVRDDKRYERAKEILRFDEIKYIMAHGSQLIFNQNE